MRNCGADRRITAACPSRFLYGGSPLFHHKKIVWLLLLPGLMGILAFYVVPFFGGVYFSLMDGPSRTNS